MVEPSATPKPAEPSQTAERLELQFVREYMDKKFYEIVSNKEVQAKLVEEYRDSLKTPYADLNNIAAGGLAGAYWGWDSIPLAWRRGMRGREIAQPLVDALVGEPGALKVRG